MKAVSLPVTLLVIVIIGFVVIMVSYFVLGPILGTAEAQTASAAMSTCCSNYVLAGYCEKDDQGNFVAFEDIGCVVDPSLSPTGQMSITELAGKSGHAPTAEGVQTACCK